VVDAAAREGDAQLTAHRRETDAIAQLRGAVNRLAVDGNDNVAFFDAGLKSRGASRLPFLLSRARFRPFLVPLQLSYYRGLTSRGR